MSVTVRKKNGLIKVMLFSAAMLWGFSFTLIKDVTEEMPTFFLLALRFTAAGIVLGLVFFKKWKLFDKKYLLHGLISGALLFSAYIFQTEGIRLTTPGKNAFLTSIYCVLVPFLFWAVSGKKPGKFNLFAALVCLVGIGLVSVNSELSVNKGDVLTLFSGVMFAAHIVSLSLFLKEKDPVLFTVMQFFSFGALAWICTLIFERVGFGGFSKNTWMTMVYLTLACSVLGFTFQTVGQKYINPSAASLILTLEAVFGVLFSVLFGYETLGLKTIIGFVLIFVAVVLSETELKFLKRKKDEPQADVPVEE